VGIWKTKVEKSMKQNRITTVQDLGVSPHSGKPHVLSSVGE